MKRIFLLTALVTFISISSWCETYKILFINTPTIKIGNRNLKVGDTFDDKKVIRWSSNKQAMKVKKTNSNEIRIITASQAKRLKTVEDYFGKNNKMSTRGVVSAADIAASSSAKLSLIDSICITNLPYYTENTNYFVMVYQHDGKQKDFTLPFVKGGVSITRDMFEGVEDSEEITISIYLIDNEAKTKKNITNSTKINLIPLQL